MELSSYIDKLRREVTAATELGGPEVSAAAERLLLALDPAVRMTLLEALTDAAAEISSELPAGSVDIRLRGRDLEFMVETVDSATGEPERVGPQDVPPEPVEESGDQVRITLRLPESLKARAEELATQTGMSLNGWLVDAVRMAASGRSGIHLDSGRGWSINIPHVPGFPQQPSPPSLGRRSSGWA